MYYDGRVRLVYQEGKDQCHKKYQRQTVLEFYCNKTSTTPQFDKESDESAYVFEWPSADLCPPVVEECSFVDSGGEYDLSQLTSVTANYVARGQGSQYYLINVCSGLVAQKGWALQSYMYRTNFAKHPYFRTQDALVIILNACIK